MNDDLTEDDPRVLQAAREYMAELEAGRTPDRQAYMKRHPELVVALEDAFDGIDMAQHLRLPTPVVSEVPTEPLGDFKIVREIARGGMGIVYEAQQLSLGRRVALKVLPFASGLDNKQLQRFKTEAHAAAQLHHTNIVPVYAVGCERGVHFYAMQMIVGRPLNTVIGDMRGTASGSAATVDLKHGSTVDTPKSSRGKETYRTAAKLTAQVADALEYAHENGVIHRDIKPANLLLDAKGIVWITDFGLAQVSADVSLTQTGDVFGTLRYMSPEQAGGKKALVDHRTDVYSLGATLYELLTLQPMFPGQDRHRLLNQILNEEPKAPRTLERNIPVELETICLKAIGKSPTDRYATAGEMAADLRRFLDERPILAKRPTLIERSRKWMRRHPGLVIAGVVLLAISALGMATTTALVLREKGRTDEAYLLERQRAAEAEQRFQLARRSADSIIRLANEELTDHPQQQVLRRKLLENALVYYQELIALRQNDADAQAELQATRDRVTTILADLALMQGAWQYNLLFDANVQTDLVLNATQKDQVSEWWNDMSTARGDAFRDFGRLTNDERKQRFVEEAKQSETSVGLILDAQQMQRLRQIALQLRGVSAFQDSDVIAKLQLTATQREQIRAAAPDMFFDGPPPMPMMMPMPKFGGGFGGGPPGGFKGPGGFGGKFDDGPPGPPPDDKFGPKGPGGPKGGPGFGPKKDFDGGPKHGFDDQKRGWDGGGQQAQVMTHIVKNILSAGQRTTWEEMIGKPFAGLRDGRPFGGPNGGGPNGGPKGPHKGPPDRRGGPFEGNQ